MMSDSNHVTVLQSMLLDQLAVDIGAVRAVQILQKRVIEDVDDQRVMTADGGIVYADVIVREPANGVPLLVHVVFRHHLAIQAQDQPCHVRSLCQPNQPRILSKIRVLAGNASSTVAMTTETLSRPPLSFAS